MSTIGYIFARGGSKGLPNKNLLDFNGKPLIAWSIEQALETPEIDSVYVSTDSPKIANIAIDCGAQVPFMRPSKLATDESPEILSWKHALNFEKERSKKLPKIFVSIPATSPLRNTEDISLCIKKFNEISCDLVVTVSESSRNPYFNMVKISRNGSVTLALPSNKKYSRRQDAPNIFNLTTVCYVASPKFIVNTSSILDGRVQSVKIPTERSIDIDTKLDFEIAKFLHSRRRNLN
jgi:N-acylneuraminate cytidylyltransferase